MDFVIPVSAFVAVGHPATYKTTSKFLGNWVASSDGVPKVGGLILHAIVFLFVIGLLYAIFRPRKSGFSVFGMEMPDAQQGVSTYLNPYGWGSGLEKKREADDDDMSSPYDGIKGSPLMGVAQITNA